MSILLRFIINNIQFFFIYFSFNTAHIRGAHISQFNLKSTHSLKVDHPRNTTTKKFNPFFVCRSPIKSIESGTVSFLSPFSPAIQSASTRVVFSPDNETVSISSHERILARIQKVTQNTNTFVRHRNKINY